MRIAPSGAGGFTLTSTAVSKDGGKVRRRSTTVTFRPAGQPGVFHAENNGDPLAGGVISWARIRRTTLLVYVFSVREDGRHELQTYARTISASGMELLYTRDVDGERQRRVRGKLVKSGA